MPDHWPRRPGYGDREHPRKKPLRVWSRYFAAKKGDRPVKVGPRGEWSLPSVVGLARFLLALLLGTLLLGTVLLVTLLHVTLFHITRLHITLPHAGLLIVLALRLLAGLFVLLIVVLLALMVLVLMSIASLIALILCHGPAPRWFLAAVGPGSQ
jgi:hypothetical protein